MRQKALENGQREVPKSMMDRIDTDIDQMLKQHEDALQKQIDDFQRSMKLRMDSIFSDWQERQSRKQRGKDETEVRQSLNTPFKFPSPA